MKSSPRRRGLMSSGGGAVTEMSAGQLSRLGLGELRHLAETSFGVKNASLMSRAALVEKISALLHDTSGEEMEEAKTVIQKLNGETVEDEIVEDDDDDEGQVVIQSAEGKKQVVIRGQDGSMIIQDISDEGVEEGGEVVMQEESGEQYIVQSEEGQVITEEDITEYQQHENIAEEETIAEEYDETEEAAENIAFSKVDTSEESDHGVMMQNMNKTVCHAYVICKTVKEFRDLGREMLRIHAENHGIEHASKLRMSELVREMIQHYNNVHNAGMEVSKLDLLKLNMLQLKKIKVDLRDKTPPPDISKMVPKNVVPLEEQVHHVYEKRPDICNVDIIVNNLKDMLALGTSILRPEASKHRVCNSSRKQKLQVVEELWEHYLKFHLKDTEVAHDATVKELVGEEYVEYRYEDSDGQECIVVSEGDLVAGEDIHTAAEEVTA